MPDGVAQDHHVIVLHIGHAAGNGRTGRGAGLFLIGTAGAAVIVQIIGNIRDLRQDLVEIGIQDVRGVFRQRLCGTGNGEVGCQSAVVRP